MIEVEERPTSKGIKEKLDALLNLTDKDGRQLIYMPDDEGKIYLKEEQELRCLGRILVGTRNILYTKFEDERNVFKKTNAWSINYSILKVVDHIHYETLTHDYSISKEVALEHGSFLHFQNSTEKKVYVPLEFWDKTHKGIMNIYPKEGRLTKLFGTSWFNVLKPALLSPYMDDLARKIKFKREQAIVYPSQDEVFRAFKHCPFFHTKVVIIGQDPYYDGSADGLAFSYKSGLRPPTKDKSLDVILKEIERSVYDGFQVDLEYDLTQWAKQGVLLLNTILTVEKGKPLSHKEIGWQRFTTFVLKQLFSDPNPKVFMVWGKEAKALVQEIESSNIHAHLVLKSVHPAADLHNRDLLGQVIINPPHSFSGNNHFKVANEFLKRNKRKEIVW